MLRSEAAGGGVIRLSTVTGNHDEPCDVLQARVEASDRVVVVDDVHTQQGLSTAECLLEQGRHVE
jgi:hypothetical protein